MSTCSWIMLTYNRGDIVKRSVEHNMANAGAEWDELVWVDNGSDDFNLNTYVDDLFNREEITTLVRNQTNQGAAKGYNRGMGLATCDYIMITGSDMLMPDNWLATFKKYMEVMPGNACIYSKPLDKCPERIRGAPDEHEGMPLIPALALERRIFPRSFLANVGYFPESFGKYGYDDLAWAMRAESICRTYVIPNMLAEHLGTEGVNPHDGKDAAEYHAFKQKEVQDPEKRVELARLRDLGWPRYSPFY